MRSASADAEEIVLRALDIYRYRLPLVHPVQMAGIRTTHREGILIRAFDGRHEGWGDAAPLPGFSKELLNEVRDAFLDLREGMPFHATQAVSNLPYPSARFALDSALQEILARASGSSIFPTDARQSRLDQTMLIGDELAPDIARSLAPATKAVKLKVGSPDWRVDAEYVREIRAAVGSETRIRLDANRRWRISQALDFMQAVGDFDIDFLEEPVSERKDLRSLGEPPVRVALDETLHELLPGGREDPERLVSAAVEVAPSATVFVLKPALLGSWQMTLDVIAHARARQKRVVLSSAYESGVGLRAVTALASMDYAVEPVGFDTYSRLQRDVLQPRLPMAGVDLDVAAVCSLAASINPSMLEPVATGA